MIKLGEFNTLEILRSTSVGLFLGDDEGNDILLPIKYMPETYEIGDKLNVFCYLDYEERPIATNIDPDVIVNEFQLLQVAEVNEVGAFLDWGLEKHLLVPFREQRNKMQEGQWYVVYCYLDEKSNRFLGWEVIINHKHKGLVYFNEVFKKVAVGDILTGCIKTIRNDNKIDVSLQPLGEKVLEPAANKIYETLVAHGGYLPLHDESDPEEIREEFQMSKKTFKKGIGTLYKSRKIDIKKDGIHLIE